MIPPTDERRVARRAAVRLPIEVTVDDGDSHGRWVTSLSTSGVFVEGETPTPGTHVSLSFALPGVRFGLQGDVVRTEQADDTGRSGGFGVSFTRTPASWRAVAHFLMSQPAIPMHVGPPLDTRVRVLLITSIVQGKIGRQEAASRHGVSLVQLFEWERAVRRANERRRR